MRRSLPALVWICATAALAAGAAGASADDPHDNPECIDYWGEAVYGAYGYNHYVHVDNGCDRNARCLVWTDVNEEKQSVAVAGGKHERVVTYRGSPAREFTAHAKCELTD